MSVSSTTPIAATTQSTQVPFDAHLPVLVDRGGGVGIAMSRSDGLRLRITRVLDAAPTAVWRTLTEPDQLARWWGPAGFTSPSIALDLRVGGRYRIEMKPPEGDAFVLQGEFRRIAPPSQLVYTFRWEAPDPDDRETVVMLSLSDVDGKSELALEQGPFATEARLALHRGGWTDSFDKLTKIFSAAPPARTKGERSDPE